ncbi:AAA family ATPase [Fischerella thermalis]|uniref:Uncharacterized protein n=1 Tax=Fischerella thermalis CCMEE 5318 TaxID=2019666 RepID=A0A2N6LNS6_9CYAN|nr:AAA family ATPase [Fischerella thermalis]PMB20383.1 hypothetical protein CEN47_22025 [Fischerella thermalis CCMEE 5319]PMB27236.1 hypothetical protein CEN46_01905 [Fischerella thermalis CCMEE 5318]
MLNCLFASYQARIRIVYLEAPWPELLRRNRDRPAKVPEKVLYRMKNRLEMRNITEVQVVDWVVFNERIQQRFSVITI